MCACNDGLVNVCSDVRGCGEQQKRSGESFPLVREFEPSFIMSVTI